MFPPRDHEKNPGPERVSIYLGLPARFRSPTHAAAEIAALDSAADRRALLEQVPAGGWRRWVLHEAKIAIAARIVDMPRKADRQDALAAVPDEWRDEVKTHVLRLWKAAEIRARHHAMESEAA